MRLKVCGVTQQEDLGKLSELGVSLVGVNAYEKSPRFIGKLPFSFKHMPLPAEGVLVCVNLSLPEVIKEARRFDASWVQLHGNEPPELPLLLKEEFPSLKVIRAVRVSNREDITHASQINNVDLVLFDTYSPGYGGSGKSFQWKWLSQYSGSIPFIVAGGIGIENLSHLLLECRHPLFWGIDVNSKVEFSPGKKDLTKVREIMQILHEGV